MFSCEIVLAAVLLSAPKDLPMSSDQAGWVEAMRPCLLTLAVDAEILDPRERSFLMTQDPVGDLAMLRGRNEEFARAP